MSAEKTTGLVIRQADFSESSRVVTFFTRDFGKIAVVAKGAKRLKGPFESALDLLAESRLVFLRKSSGGLDILTECQLMARFRPPERNLNSLYGGYYVAELLTGLTEEYDPHPVLYDEAVITLRRLAEEADFRWPVLRFEVITLREIGQMPDFRACRALHLSASSMIRALYAATSASLVTPFFFSQSRTARSIPASLASISMIGGLKATFDRMKGLGFHLRVSNTMYEGCCSSPCLSGTQAAAFR